MADSLRRTLDTMEADDGGEDAAYRQSLVRRLGGKPGAGAAPSANGHTGGRHRGHRYIEVEYTGPGLREYIPVYADDTLEKPRGEIEDIMDFEPEETVPFVAEEEPLEFIEEEAPEPIVEEEPLEEFIEEFPEPEPEPAAEPEPEPEPEADPLAEGWKEVSDEEAERARQGFRIGPWTLYDKPAETAAARRRKGKAGDDDAEAGQPVYFFTRGKKRPTKGRPAPLPEGYEAVLDPESGLPYLRRVGAQPTRRKRVRIMRVRGATREDAARKVSQAAPGRRVVATMPIDITERWRS